jgi:choline-sulfatase
MRRGPAMIAAFALAGWLYGGAEAAFVAPAGSRAATVFAGAVLGSLPAMMLGLVAWVVAGLFTKLPGSRAVVAWYERTSTADPEADREPVIGFTAYVLGGLAIIGASAAVSPIAYRALFDLQVEALAVQMSAVFAALQVIGALLAIPIVAIALRPLLRRLDRRWRLPLPRPAWARVLLFLTVPMLLAIQPLLNLYGSMLAWIRDLLLLAMVLTLGTTAYLAIARLRVRSADHVRMGVVVVAVIALVAVAASPGVASARAAAEGAMVASLGARIGRAVSDVDRDGSSSLFAGGDCAAFDAARGPAMYEIPGNGVDEDCDGRDGDPVAVKPAALAPFSDALQPDQVRRYNVVWVIMETVRADHVSAYGYPKPTMPYFEELAKESFLFERAYAQSSATVLSIPSMLAGVHPAAVEWTTNQLQPQIVDSEILIAERFKARGYRTAAVVENYVQSSFPGMQQGFDVVLVGEPDRKRKFNRPRRNLYANAEAASWLAQIQPDESFFLLQYYVDPHGPYTRHPDIDNSRFSKDKKGSYDSELAWTDQALRAFIEGLRARRALWDNTIVVVTADHGEEFYEHGTHSHATSCYRESVGVPLLVRVPGFEGRRIAAPVALVDIVPTLLELTGAREDLDRLSGQSLLAPALNEQQTNETRAIFCSIASITDKYGTFFRRSVRIGKYALVGDITRSKFELFDMDADPGEKVDIADQHAQRVESMKGLLDASLTGNLRDHTRMRKP